MLIKKEDGMKIEKDLRNICKNVSRNLVFIQYENTNVRISEQESRVLFCDEIEKYNKELYYAIEVPTVSKYRFSEGIRLATNGRSGCSDLSLFYRDSNSDNRKFKQIVNIELKAHNVDVLKDLLKLAAEPKHGLFFHTLRNIDKGTLINNGRYKGVIEKYREIKKYKKEFNKPVDGGEKFILFAICIIEMEILLMKTLRKSDLNSLEKFFSINYDKICENNPSDLNDGWTQTCLSKRKKDHRLIFPAYKNDKKV